MLLSAALFLVQVILFGLLVWALARLLAKSRRLSRLAIVLSCLIVGLLSGLLTAWLWPKLDSILYPNIAGFLLGEQIYLSATGSVQPGTLSPHDAIIWPLRTPQVYVFTSALLFALIGLGLQLAYNHRREG